MSLTFGKNLKELNYKNESLVLEFQMIPQVDSGFLIQINKEIIEKIETLQSIFPKNNERLLFNKIEQKDNTLEILTALLEHLNQLYIFFEAIDETGAEFKKNLERLKNLHYEISMWLSKRGEENIFWLEIFSRSMQFNITPLSIAEKFKEFRDANDMSWIFTSATLTVDEKFDHFHTTMGLEDATLEKFNSPFDYKKIVFFMFLKACLNPMKLALIYRL